MTAIASSYDVSMALLADGTMRAWGLDLNPAPEGLREVVAIAGGAAHRLALRADGTVVAWGSNAQGQLDVPEELTDAVAISAGGYFSVATRANGEIVVWEEASLGEINADSPVGIAAGRGHLFAVSGGPGPIRIRPTPGPDENPSLAVTPNPASGAVRVQFDAEGSDTVALDLLDVRGRRIATLLNGSPEASGGEVAFDVAAMDLAPGVYLVRLRAADRVSTVRFAVMR